MNGQGGVVVAMYSVAMVTAGQQIRQDLAGLCSSRKGSAAMPSRARRQELPGLFWKKRGGGGQRRASVLLSRHREAAAGRIVG